MPEIIQSVAVGTESATKVAAVKNALSLLLPENKIQISTKKVASGVPDQPFGLDETTQGAVNRAELALAYFPEVQIGIGLEGGVFEQRNRLIDFGVVYVLGRNGLYGIATSEGIALPHGVAELIQGGMELSDAMQELYGLDTVATRDCSGYLTNGRLPSEKYYQAPVMSALTDYLLQVA